jgi:hypothetical protein
VDFRGDVIVTGIFQGSADFGCAILDSTYGGYDSFVAKYSGADGSCLWARNFVTNGDDEGNGVAVNGSGDVFLTGYFVSILDFGNGVPRLTGVNGKDIYMAKLSGSNGLALWARQFGSTGDQIGRDIVVDGNGDALITGSFAYSINFGGTTLNAVGFNDAFVAKFSGSNGAHRWSRNFLSAFDDLGEALAVDTDGDVIVTGQFTDTINFGGVTLVSAGSADIFVAKLSGTNGSHLWSRSFGAATNDVGYGVTAGPGGEVLSTGQFVGTVDFGTGPMTSAGSTDCFLLGIAP